MKLGLLSFLAGTPLVSALANGAGLEQRASVNSTCSSLAQKYPGQVELPGSSNYTTESTSYWSLRSGLAPGCIFVPTTSQNLAGGVKILAQANTKFAIRSGGHSPTAGINNINEGVLIVTTHFNNMTITNMPNNFSTPYFVMGANVRWGQAYSYLSSRNLAVVGGRVPTVGSSLLLGGGVSYLSNRNGWASNNVVNYEVITAQGQVLQVNQKSSPDLFWALKAGANNFGIVTRYSLKIVPQGKVWGGTIAYLPTAIQDYLDAQQAFISPGGGIEDIDAAIQPSFNYVPAANQTNATFIGLYNKPNVNNPKPFENFTKIANSSASVGIKGYSDFVAEAAELGGTGVARANWFATAMAVTNDTMNFQYKTMIDTANKIIPGLPVIAGMASEPITHYFAESARANGGDPIGLDPAKGNFVIALVYGLWFDPAQDAIMQKYLTTLIANLDAGSKARGAYYPYIFGNYAGNTQNPFSLYDGGKSLPILQRIAKKYDPQGVFQKLVPGFKLDGPVTNLPLDY